MRPLVSLALLGAAAGLLVGPTDARAQAFSELNPTPIYGVTITSNSDASPNGEAAIITDKGETVFHGESGVGTTVRNDEGNVLVDAGDDVVLRMDGDAAGGGALVVEDWDGGAFTEVIRSDVSQTTLNSSTTQVNGAADLNGSLDVDGFTTTDGIENAGQVETDTLLVNGNSDLNGNLDVDGYTFTDGISNSGEISTGTLVTTGNADLNGDLDVDGHTWTDGITNDGAFHSTGPVTGAGGAVLRSVDTRSEASVDDAGARLRRTDAGGAVATVETTDAGATLSHADGGTTNAVVVSDTQTTSIGANSFNYGTRIDGGALVNGDLGVNGSIYALNPNANVGVNIANNGLDIEGASNTVSLIADGNNVDVDGRGQVVLEETAARFQVFNADTGEAHGLRVEQRRTVLSGGTSTTNLTLDDSGATFDDDEGGPARVRGVDDGRSRYDAVNYGQLQEAEGGVASVAALTSIPSLQTDKRFNVGLGAGTFSGEHALAVGASLRLGRHVVVKGGAGRSTDSPWTGSFGFALSW